MHQALSLVFHLCLDARNLPVRIVFLPFHRRKPRFRALLPRRRHKWKLPSHPPLIISPEKRVTKARVSGTRALPGNIHSLPFSWCRVLLCRSHWAGPGQEQDQMAAPDMCPLLWGDRPTDLLAVLIVKRGGRARPGTDPVQEDLRLCPCLLLPSQHLHFGEMLEGRGNMGRGGGNCACY